MEWKERIAESFWSYVLGKMWPMLIIATLMLMAVLVYIISFIPAWINILVIGLLGGFVLSLVVGRLIIWHRQRFFVESELLPLHKQMIFYIGDISNHTAVYKDILRDLTIEGKPDGWINKHRRELQSLKYLVYSDGIVELTNKGLRLYDKWLERCENFNPPTSKNSKSDGQT